ncbi:MAG: O-antigen ligase family protein [Anaerolineae bacterium]|nr:O-antigen ligase family protein [Anaerolineae bacterium]
MSARLRAAAGWIARGEPALVLLVAPLLLFPTLRPAWTAAALGALVAVWLLSLVGTGYPAARTPLDLSLLLLALMIPIAAWISPFPDLTLPKVTGLILGLAAFRAAVHAVRTPSDLRLAAALFLLLGLGFVLVGAAGAYWPAKLSALQPLLARLPRLVHDLPGTEYGVHPNELGGTVLFFLPVALAVVVGRRASPGAPGVTARAAALLLFLLLAAVLLLAQSRSAWIGALAGLAAVVCLRWRRARWLALAAALLLAMWLFVMAPELSVQVRDPGPDARTVVDAGSLGERGGPWARGLDLVAHFPLTGGGLGAFRQLAHLFGPLPLAQADPDIGHAHNVFLQVAVDVGLPGLVAYVALLGTALWCAWGVLRRAGGPFHWLAIGIIGSLVAFHVYGLADTVALGAKPGLAFWLLLALAAAAWNVVRKAEPA